jgi:hypothetical protein
MSETQDPQPPKPDKITYVPGQPLPRLWKTEPDTEEDSEESLENPKKKKGSKDQDVAAAASKSPSKPKGLASKTPEAKPKKKKDGGKRVLLEDTPALDTIESRQRARMAMGALMVFCVGIFGWILYGMIFSGSSDFTVDAVELPPQAAILVPGPAPSREPEAQYMLDRARDYAKGNQIAQALAMLKRVVAVYKGTRAAGEAQAALDRTRQNLPLFPDGPVVVAQKSAGENPPPGPAAPPGPATPPVSVTAPGSSTPGPAPSPGPGPMPPPQVADGGAPPAPAHGPTRHVPPGPSLNPGTVGPPTTTGPAMNPAVARTSPAPAANGPGGQVGSPPASPAPGPAPAPGPDMVARAPTPPQPSPTPPGPGDAAVLIPANPGNPGATPPVDGHPNPEIDRGTPAPRGRVARTLPPGFKARPEAGLHESGWPLVIVGDRDGGTMVLVPGGTFMMGSDSGDPWNGPAHSVRLSTYYIDQHEVTNRQFRTFLEDARYHGHPPGKWLTDEKQRSLPDAAPAVFVSYQDAEAYAIWALKRLPTEAQWEMAARSLDGRRYPWGDQPVRWSHPRKFQQVDLVGSYPEDVSPYGVQDLAGNAMEWVRDWYDPRYFDRMRDKTTEDPSGPPGKRQGIQRTVKGGSKDWLVFTRQGMDSDRRLPYVGFRCSLAVEGGEASAIIAPHPEKPATPPPGTPPPGGQAPGGNVPF